MLHMNYTTPENAAEDAQALLEFAVVAIPMETFTVHTSVTLKENEMAAHAQSYSHSLSMLLALQPFIIGALAAISTF